MKVFVLGLDGATSEILDPLLESGQMPHLRALCQTGARGPLLSTVPPTSPVAWSTFTTGKNPGKHGVYDFLEFSHRPLEGRVNSSLSVKSETIWEIVTRAGLRSVVAGVALTAPVRPGGGTQIGDFMSSRKARSFCSDPELLAAMDRELGPYEPWCSASYHRENEELVLERLRKFLDYHLAAIRYLLGHREWDLFCYNLMAVDRLHHELWHVWDETHPFRKGRDLKAIREKFVDFFCSLDRAIGEFQEKLPPDTAFIILSDHGNGSVTHYLNLNLWLLREGYVVLKPGMKVALKHWLFERGKNPAWGYRRLARMGFADMVTRRVGGGQLGWLDRFTDTIFLSRKDIDWTKTRAYAQGNYGQIYVNLRGRQPEGAVEPGPEAEALMEELRSRLLELEFPDTGETMVGKVHRADDVFHGSQRFLAPDLLVELRDPRHHTLGLFDFTTHKLIMRTFTMSGDHRMEGVFFASGPAFQAGSTPQSAALCDLAPTILHLLGVPIPRDMDGRVLLEVLAGEERRSPTYAGPAVPPDKGPDGSKNGSGADGESRSKEEEEEIIKRLESLGYL